ncbi:MAG: hypothetical protein LBN96_01585, partial [Desulfovibrio sp.]|nr:hypothetical protein [Desulfovibrio sp.]
MEPEQGALAGQSVILPADSIRHRNKKHPDMTDQDMDRLPQVLDSLTPEQMRLPKKDKPQFSGKGFLAWAIIDDQAYGLVLESVGADKIIIGTYFKDTERGIRAWLERSGDEKKAVTTPAALWPYSQASQGGRLREQPSSARTVPDAGEKGKTFEQPAFHGSPKRGIESMSTDFIGEGEGAQAFGWGLYFTESRSIPGLRYLDGTSRAKGEGSHNFVIWNDEAVDILRTFYQGQGHPPRGQVSFDGTGGSVTSFFESADLSTPIHESAHVFVNDLIRVVMDNGAEA